jgi:hypothetical protein
MPNSPTSIAKALVIEAVLGRRVVPVARCGLRSRRRAHDDDGAAVSRLDHRGYRRADGPPGPVQIDVDDGVPLLLGHLEHAAPAEDSRVGDDDVEAAELFDTVGDHLLLGGQVADVDLARQHLAPLLLHRADGVSQLGRRRRRVRDGVGHGATDVYGDDVGALAGQSDGVRPSLSAGGARDECHASLEGPVRCRHCQSFRQTALRLAGELERVLVTPLPRRDRRHGR